MKKTVSFDQIPASPTPLCRVLPRVSEAQESEAAIEDEEEECPALHLSDIMNLEPSPSPEPKDVEAPTSSGILSAVLIFVDICGSDGSSCNYCFIPLLEELGATVLENLDEGATHVLFKDGSDRTLKTVSQSKGNTKCVNVGWVLE